MLMQRSFPRSVTELLLKHGDSRVAEAVQTFASGVCGSQEYFAIPNTSVNGAAYYVIVCRTLAGENDTILVADENGRRILGPEADSALANFGEVIERRIRRRLETFYVSQMWAWMSAGLFLTFAFAYFIISVAKISYAALLAHPLAVGALTCLGIAILALYLLPWLVREQKGEQLFEDDESYEDVMRLQAIYPAADAGFG